MTQIKCKDLYELVSVPFATGAFFFCPTDQQFHIIVPSVIISFTAFSFVILEPGVDKQNFYFFQTKLSLFDYERAILILLSTMTLQYMVWLLSGEK